MPESQAAQEFKPVKINKWDATTIVEETFPWQEKHTLVDIRLFISFISVVFAASAMIYDYLHPYPASAHVCAFCSLAYFVTMGILQLYMMYIEKCIFYQGVEKQKAGDRVWCFAGDMHRFDDKYTLTVSYRQGNSTGSADVTKSVSNFITEEGEVINSVLRKEVKQLINKLSKRE